MGINYECKLCNYETSKKGNYSRHVGSVKHHKKVRELNNLSDETIQLYPKDIPIVSQLYPKIGKNEPILDYKKVSKKVNSDYKCDTCGSSFTKANNLARHYKACMARNKIKEENSKLKNKVDDLEDYIDLLKSDLVYYKNLIKDAGVGSGAKVKITTNVQSLIVSKHEDAPALEYSKPNILQFDSDDNHKNALFLINRFRDNTFARFVGKCIVAAYKKEDPDEQSLWSTDANRLTMFIKKMMADDNSKWISDKKGVQTMKYIVDPLLKRIKTMLFNYNEFMYPQLKKMPCHEVEYYNNILLKGRELVHHIDEDKVGDEILKYIAPRLTYEIK